MRWIARGWLVAHPAIANGLIVARWTAWVLLGHPIATSIAALTLAFRLPPIWFLIAIGLDGFTGAIVSEVGPARFGWLWHWQRACRFRRRWPSVATEIGAAVDAYLPAGRAGESVVAPHRYRPVLAAPRLSFLPNYADASEVAWAIRPAAARTFEELAELVAQIPAVDRCVASAGLERASNGSGRWLLVVICARANLRQPEAHIEPPVDEAVRPTATTNTNTESGSTPDEREIFSRHVRRNAAPGTSGPWRPRSNRQRRDEWNRRRDGHDDA